jgi:hypothetical protein
LDENEPSAFVTDAVAVDYDKAVLAPARDAVAVLVEGVARGTHAFALGVEDEAAASGTRFNRCAFYRGVPLVSGKTDANHGPDG